MKRTYPQIAMAGISIDRIAADGRSLQQIAGRMRLERHPVLVRHETI